VTLLVSVVLTVLNVVVLLVSKPVVVL
jgi:hypothetical protein